MADSKLGVLPPEEFAWQEGTTAGSIEFVQDAEEWLKDNSGDTRASRLREYVKDLRAGRTDVIKDGFDSIEDFLGSEDR